MLNISKQDYSVLDKYITAGRIKNDSGYVFTFDRIYIVFFRFSGKRYSYSVLNYATEKIVLLTTSRAELTERDYPQIVKKIIHSKVYRFELPPQPETLIASIFKDMLPEYGYAVRDKQIELSQMMLDSMRHKKAALCEAEVGTGKTYRLSCFRHRIRPIRSPSAASRPLRPRGSSAADTDHHYHIQY